MINSRSSLQNLCARSGPERVLRLGLRDSGRVEISVLVKRIEPVRLSTGPPGGGGEDGADADGVAV